MKEELPRLDSDNSLKEKILPFCRLKNGGIWEDPVSGHRVGVLDACRISDVDKIMNSEKTDLLINDPPYNIEVGNKNTDNLFKDNTDAYIDYSKKWLDSADHISSENSYHYIWLGADQKNNFSPLPEFMLLMKVFDAWKSKSFITLRNQRGYGTQKNWMCIRQELLCYQKGKPDFNVVYTDIPKVLKGYYKTINGKKTENMERSKSDTIRPGNVWIDIQQVFYRMKENVPGAYAQKSLKAIDRIIRTSSTEKSIITDFFAHSGTTLLASEIAGRKCYTFDIDPVFAELSIRRLEHYRKTGQPGWQCSNPFPETGNIL